MGDALSCLQMVPVLKELAEHRLSMSYDVEADVLCVNFKASGLVAEGQLGEDDVMVRRDGGEVVGYSILHTSQR